jgi:hypothetical protein
MFPNVNKFLKKKKFMSQNSSVNVDDKLPFNFDLISVKNVFSFTFYYYYSGSLKMYVNLAQNLVNKLENCLIPKTIYQQKSPTTPQTYCFVTHF